MKQNFVVSPAVIRSFIASDIFKIVTLRYALPVKTDFSTISTHLLNDDSMLILTLVKF
jgi:hypothetical protein